METGRSNTETGLEAQRLAEGYLCRQGLQLRERNYRCRGGEIDLVMQAGATLVFVEVRYRKHSRFGGALASVDTRKQQRLWHAAQHYLQRTRATEMPCRFDVVAISPGKWGHPSVEWVQNAIQPD